MTWNEMGSELLSGTTDTLPVVISDRRITTDCKSILRVIILPNSMESYDWAKLAEAGPIRSWPILVHLEFLGPLAEYGSKSRTYTLHAESLRKIT